MVGFTKKTIKDVNIKGKTVLVRADYNVPLNGEKQIQSNYRITESIPTLQYLIENKCRIVITTHLGRPKGIDSAYSVKPIAKELSKLLKKPVSFVSDCIGDSVKQAVDAMQPGDVTLLENVRFHTEEEKRNDKAFVEALVSDTGAEIFVQDCFGVAHRAHASIVGPTEHLPAVSGLLLEKEVSTITRVMQKPRKPVMAIVGGAKIGDKIDIIHAFIRTADIVVIGGAMANTFLKAHGTKVGKSLVDNEELDTAHDIIEQANKEAKERDFIFYLPQDVVVADEIASNAKTRIVGIDTHTIATIEAQPMMPKSSTSTVSKHEMILDIGPISSAFITGAMQGVKTVIWNGTMGVTETKALRGDVGPFAHGTDTIMEAMIGHFGNKPFSVLGGGDTTAYVDQRRMNDFFDHVSTGGGASLELMSGKELPGVACLEDKG